MILGFVFSWQVDKNQANTQNIQKENLLVFVETAQSVTPPLILEEDLIQPEKVKEQISKSKIVKKDPNAITAEAYLVGNYKTGEVYLEHNSDLVFPIASISKLFTALIATHFIDLKKEITITQQALDTQGDAGGLIIDEKYTVDELLYPLLLESSNDAAEAIALSYGYTDFISSMNSLVMEIGLNKTSFKDASGLNPSNVSNAKDLFMLAKYINENEKALLDITDKKEFSFSTTTEHGSHDFININPFVNYPPFIGGKTGRTQEAKESMISLFNIEINSISYPVAVIILRSDFGEREIDTERLIERAQKIITKK